MDDSEKSRGIGLIFYFLQCAWKELRTEQNHCNSFQEHCESGGDFIGHMQYASTAKSLIVNL